MPLPSADELRNRINTNYSQEQWQAWLNEGGFQGQEAGGNCPADKPFKTSKKVSGGDPNACVDHPDACPPGTTAWGINECVAVGSRPNSGGGTQGQPGQPGQSEVNPAFQALEDPLQAKLFQLFQDRGAPIQGNNPTNAFSLGGGGVLSFGNNRAGGPLAAPAPQQRRGGGVYQSKRFLNEWGPGGTRQAQSMSPQSVSAAFAPVTGQMPVQNTGMPAPQNVIQQAIRRKVMAPQSPTSPWWAT